MYRLGVLEIKMKTLFDLGILTDSEAHGILEKHYPGIAACIRSGWQDYEFLIRVAPDQCLNFTATTRANIVQNNMVKHAQRLFGQTEDVLCYQSDGIFTVDFYGKIRLRFKKLDNSLKPSNIPTSQQQEFSFQTLFGPSSTKVTAGYRLDRSGLTLRDIHLVCFYSDELLWNIQLDEYVTANAKGDIAEATPVPGTPGTRIVPRKSDAERAHGV
jgi:hypothetical protein